MGWGDEIMITGEIRRKVQKRARRFMIGDLRKPGLVRWNAIWEGNPHICRPGVPYDEIYYNHGGNRPYIVSKSMNGFTWKPYEPIPGEIYLTARELVIGEFARGKVVLHPFIKSGASGNKAWAHTNWQRLVDSMPEVHWLEIGETGSTIRGAQFLKTNSFREACAVMKHARAAVLHEGGLHHAAAAFGTQAVVIYGGFIGPKVTGYAYQRNLFVEDRRYPLGCGLRVHCPHCVSALAQISPSLVAQSLKEVL